MELKNKNILVTGGAGFIGSHLVDALIKESPSNLIILDNFSFGKESNLEEAKKNFPELKICRDSLTELEKVREIITNNNIDIVYNLAVVSLPLSLKKPEWVFDEIINMTKNLCILAKEKAFDFLVHFSSSEVYGTAQTAPITEKHPINPHTPYAAAKAAADYLINSYIKTFGIKAIIIRPFNNYGPRLSDGIYSGVIPATIRKILNNQKPLLNGNGEQTRDFIYVQDTAEIAIELSKCDQAIGKTINIGSGKEISIKDLIKKISMLLNYEGEIETAPERPGDVKRLLAGTKFAEEHIDFKIKTDFDQGLKKTIEWYKGGYNGRK